MSTFYLLTCVTIWSEKVAVRIGFLDDRHISINVASLRIQYKRWIYYIKLKLFVVVSNYRTAK